MIQFWALIKDSFRESIDRKIFWAMIFISFIVTCTMLCIGFHPDRVSVFFGAWEWETTVYDPTSELGRGNIAAIAVWCMDFVVGWVGVMLAVIATAGFFPSLMERGSVDVVVSKPISRAMLFLGKYAGTMVFVLLQAIIFVVPTFLVIGLRWGTWIPGYLLSIPLLLVLFSYLYCVSVWVAVSTRSTLAAIFASMGAWVVFFGIQSAGDAFEMFPKWKEQRLVYNTTRVMRMIVPKTQDITYLAERWSGADPSADMMGEPPDDQSRNLMERARALVYKRRQVSAPYTIGSSLIFELLVILWAMWKFCRRDF